jgi:ribosomal protein S18 acetylase RimI-like enzyme
MLVNELSLTISHEDTDLANEIHQRIKTHNRTAQRDLYFDSDGHEVQYQPFVLALRDLDGELLAGLSAGTAWSSMLIEDLWVADWLRGQGIGSELLRRAEAEAHVRGCGFVWLRTFSFQARGFYEKLGYRVVGTLEDYPPGHAFYTMRKDLKD